MTCAATHTCTHELHIHTPCVCVVSLFTILYANEVHFAHKQCHFCTHPGSYVCALVSTYGSAATRCRRRRDRSGRATPTRRKGLIMQIVTQPARSGLIEKNKRTFSTDLHKKVSMGMCVYASKSESIFCMCVCVLARMPAGRNGCWITWNFRWRTHIVC